MSNNFSRSILRSSSLAGGREDIALHLDIGFQMLQTDIIGTCGLGNAACYLCSDEASMVTGAVLRVDGGRCI